MTDPTKRWALVITSHVEFRSDGRTANVYSPMALQPLVGIGSAKYCNHRHTSWDAATRCGKRMVRQQKQKEVE